MPALQVKDCPIYVYEKLRQCAIRENRSISQQALTIIEEYLDIRERAYPSRYADGDAAKTERIARRREAFARIEAHRPIPVSKEVPRSDEIMAEIRREEAR